MRGEDKSCKMLPVDCHLTTKLEMLLEKNRNVRKQCDIGRAVLPAVAIEPDSALLF